MKVESVKAVFPSRELANEEIIGLVEKHSKATFEGDLDAALEQIRFYLAYSGAESRRWLAPGEKPIELLSRAVEQALDEAGCGKDDIDLLVYTGIGRGFIEPGAAYMIARALQMYRVVCFDVLDACMSWSRALEIVHGLFMTRNYKRALVVNAEFNMRAGGHVFPANYALRNIDEIAWQFPSYTLGEAATATVLSADPDRPWEFNFASRTDFADLCTVPLKGYEDYCHPDERIGKNGPNRFTSYGSHLFEMGAPEAIALFKTLKAPIGEVKAIFPHSASKRLWHDMGKTIDVDHLIWFIYPKTGNVVSASVPAAMAETIDQGHVRRGDRVVGWVGSAGMSFCAYSFVY